MMALLYQRLAPLNASLNLVVLLLVVIEVLQPEVKFLSERVLDCKEKVINRNWG
jgi:hypothetical protein